MRIIADRSTCEGHKYCIEAAPKVFRLGDDGKVVVEMPSPPPELEDDARDAVDLCPLLALRVEED